MSDRRLDLAGRPDRIERAQRILSDIEEATALIGQLVDAEPMSLAAFERYEALGVVPPGVLDRVRQRSD